MEFPCSFLHFSANCGSIPNENQLIVVTIKTKKHCLLIKSKLCKYEV